MPYLDATKREILRQLATPDAHLRIAAKLLREMGLEDGEVRELRKRLDALYKDLTAHWPFPSDGS
jgi:hypothetical protein